MCASITNLPNEVLLYIINFLEKDDILITLPQVCQKFYNIINGLLKLQKDCKLMPNTIRNIETYLDLSCNINVISPPELIGNLTDIIHISFYGCFFLTTIPKSIGNLKNLKKTREVFKRKNSPEILEKPNEAIWFANNRAIKYAEDKTFISDRIQRSKILKGYVPEVIDFNDNMYCYKLINGKTTTNFAKSINCEPTL